MRDDTTIFPVMEKLLECAEAEFVRSDIPVPGYVTMQAGAAIALDLREGDESCGDYLWVRLSTAYESESFPNAAVAGTGRQWPVAGSIEVGVARCVPGLDYDNEPPTPADNRETVRLQLADMAALRRAICACMKDLDRDFLLGEYSPRGPEGLLAGGIWTVLVSGAS